MGNLPGNPVHYALENQVDDVFYISNSTFAIVRGSSLSRSQPDLGVFLRVLRFSSLSKIDSQSKTSGLGAVL